jgi:hypothetical protein
MDIGKLNDIIRTNESLTEEEKQAFIERLDFLRNWGKEQND